MRWRGRSAGTVALVVVVALLCPSSSSAAPARPEIVGGSAASITDFPYQVWVTRQGEDLVCGGSILDATHVLTAAHCVIADGTNYPSIASPAAYKVGYGSASRSSGMTFRGVSRIVVDRRYQRQLESDAYDSAILQLATPIALSASAAPIVPATASELASALGSGRRRGGHGMGSHEPDRPGVHLRCPARGRSSAGLGLRVRADLRELPGGGFCGSGHAVCGDRRALGVPGRQWRPAGDRRGRRGRRLAGVTSLVLGDNGGNLCNAGGSPAVFTEVSEPGTRSLLLAPPAIDPPALPAGTRRSRERARSAGE